MKKLLIADDEPLVLIGVQSMLKSADQGVEVCATARNGQQALELIEQIRPDIVITDIKMPIMSGLEVAQACRKRYGALPVFIMLTSYEEFSFVKDAMHLGAVEYLVKLELTPSSLAASVARAAARVEEITKSTSGALTAERGSLAGYREKFFVRLYNGLFESREQFLRQKEDLNIDFSAKAYAVAVCSIADGGAALSTEKLATLCTSTVQMVRENVEKFTPCYVTSLDLRHFNIVFCLQNQREDWAAYLKDVLQKTITLVHNYFNVRLLCSIGLPVEDAFQLGDSYHSARAISPPGNGTGCVVAASEQGLSKEHRVFNLSVFRSELTHAFEELNTDALDRTITEIVGCFTAQPQARIQAMDAASSLLYMALTLLPDGESTVEHIFSDNPENYRALYRQTTTKQCCRWMEKLRDGLCDILQTRRQSYKERIVASVKEYIKANLDKKLTLNGVAEIFSFSPNYLSQLFARYSENGFVDYITEEKISASKTMLAAGDQKIYEIAEQLGYENAFYFSKVFKKVTGQSPREYMQHAAL